MLRGTSFALSVVVSYPGDHSPNLGSLSTAISQISPCGLQHLSGILVLSYERWMTLDGDYFVALLSPINKSGASIAKECIPMFRSSWSLKGISFIILFLRFQRTCSLLGTFFVAARSIGATFLRSESVLQSHITSSRTQPNLPVEEFSDLNMDEFVTYEISVERERERSPRTNKSPSTKTLLPLMGWSFLQRSGSVTSSLTRLEEVAPIRSLANVRR
ncbi:hypothetical protein DY000_02024046 [Brassica cretica]|uniref:Uncharacterized protein n=1 Tax=Brassica cretica TaxID=69181 RepID=A0ABQ7E0I0_BRACR|nr:hypothetical protein DY000_02024046 [Brassica cretica]